MQLIISKLVDLLNRLKTIKDRLIVNLKNLLNYIFNHNLMFIGVEIVLSIFLTYTYITIFGAVPSAEIFLFCIIFFLINLIYVIYQHISNYSMIQEMKVSLKYVDDKNTPEMLKLQGSLDFLKDHHWIMLFGISIPSFFYIYLLGIMYYQYFNTKIMHLKVDLLIDEIDRDMDSFLRFKYKMIKKNRELQTKSWAKIFIQEYKLYIKQKKSKSKKKKINKKLYLPLFFNLKCLTCRINTKYRHKKRIRFLKWVN